jgi:hypothetical protein
MTMEVASNSLSLIFYLKNPEQGLHVESSDPEGPTDGGQAEDDAEDKKKRREANVQNEEENSGRGQHLGRADRRSSAGNGFSWWLGWKKTESEADLGSEEISSWK